MIEILVTIILIPIALVALVVLGSIAILTWKFIVALILWAIALIMFLFYRSTMYWWAFTLFWVGCGFWASATPNYEDQNKN